MFYLLTLSSQVTEAERWIRGRMAIGSSIPERILMDASIRQVSRVCLDHRKRLLAIDHMLTTDDACLMFTHDRAAGPASDACQKGAPSHVEPWPAGRQGARQLAHQSSMMRRFFATAKNADADSVCWLT
jgi:hypothetical protein